MPKNPHQYVSWRDGRPRFQPPKALRDRGFKGTDLRWPEPAPAAWDFRALKPGEQNGGRWFSKGEAVDWSAAFVRLLERDLKKPAAGGTVTPRKAPKLYTVAMMVRDWQTNSPKFIPDGQKAYRPNTRRFYAQKVHTIENDHPLIWNAPAQLLGRHTLRAAFEEIWRDRGLSAARAAIASLSKAFSWAMLTGRVRRADNPAFKLQMETPEPRIRFATRTEFEAFVAAADAAGRPELGDMAYLAVWTGQRQDDRLQLLATQNLGDRRIFRQAKTGAIVAIRKAPELEARLAAAARRRAAVRAAALLAAPTPEARRLEEIRFAHVVLDERTWKPFADRFTYARAFAEIRDLAAQGSNELALAPCPSIGDFHDADWRDTSVTWQGLASCTIPEIIAVTGHTAESATRILKHYLARHPEMADSAIGKLMEWYEGRGETEFGL